MQIKTSKSFPGLLIFSCFLFLCSLTVDAYGQEKLAVISKFTGNVAVERKGQSLTVEQRGNRIRNSSIYNKDSVLTKAVSSAELVFTDNTRFEIKENTNFSISTEKITGDKDKLRTVNLLAGGFLADITPSKSILTEFETPTGTASVRGTTLDINYDPTLNQTALDLRIGTINYSTPNGEATFDMGVGDVVNVAVSQAGDPQIGVQQGSITVNVAGGTATIPAGAAISVTIDATGATQISVTSGSVTFTDSSGTTHTIQAGQTATVTQAATSPIVAIDTTASNTEQPQDKNINVASPFK